ncbi:MAG: heme ABC exporter ATP-binding protein CcmA [Rhodospirillales bacterium]
MSFSGHALTCQRGGRLVFTGLDFAVGTGDALLLTGANGSGKSSLLRMMAGLLTPAEGNLRLDGNPVTDDPDNWRASLAFVGHHDPVKPVMTVRENLGFWASLAGSDRLDEALAAFGLEDLADTPGRFLSAGQRRRTNLARLLVSRARVWLLDEPSTALDRHATSRLETVMAAHRAAGGMIVASSHIPLELEQAARLTLGQTRRPERAG